MPQTSLIPHRTKRVYHRKSHDPHYCRGEQHPRHRLSEEAVQEIRRRYFSDEGISQAQLGREFGIGQTHVSQIVCGKLWKPKKEVSNDPSV